MSRIGNRVITVPEGVTVENIDNVVTVKGPKGTLTQVMLKDITMKQEENTIILERKNESAKAMHGTMNALIQNMIIGVTKGYEKGLEILGVGYRFNVQGTIELTLKYTDKKERVINGLKRISKPGLRVYVEKDEVPKVLNGLGIAIISTSKGIMTDKEARKENIGGEVLAYIW